MSNRLTTVALGYYVKEQLDKKCISTERVANLLDCKVSDVDMFLRGEAFCFISANTEIGVAVWFERFRAFA